MKTRTIVATLVALCFSLFAATSFAQSSPGAPTITSVGGAPTTLTVVWTAPNSDGGPSITSYDVRYIGSAETDRADERWTEVIGAWTSGSLTYTITGLPGNVSYDVQVRAVNEIGAGDWSETGTATVSDPPQVSVSLGQSAYTVLEGETLYVPITLSAAPQRTVTIPVQARNGYRTYDDDYSVSPTSVTFNTGDTEQTITFTANLDRSVDGGSVHLSFGTLPEGMTAGATSRATVSITDATLLVKFKLPRGLNPYYDNSQFTVKEGHTVDVTVELSPAPQDRVVIIPLTAVHNGSTTPADYSMPANVTFTGDETSKTFTFTAVEDDENDDSDSVVIDFNASRHSFSPGVGAAPPTWTTIFITDNDDPQVEVTFGLGSIRVPEGESRGVTVWLSTDPERTVVIPFTVTKMGGASDADYSVPTSVEFRSGEREKTLWLRAEQDTDYDEGESVLLAFGELPDRVSVGVLLTETTFKIDDDDAPQVTVSFDQATYTVDEGDTEATEVTVSLSADPQRTVTIGITTRGWGGLTYADYSGVPESLTFDSGETSKSFDFRATDDTDNDNDESVQLGFWALSTGVTVGTPGQTTLNINDTDLPWVVFVSFDRTRYIVNEGETEHIVVKLNRAPDHTVVIPIAATGQLGASSGDFSVQTSVTFNAQDRSKTIAFTATQDTVDDEDEVVWLTFGTLPNRVGSQNPINKFVEINDDDGAAVSVSRGALSIGEGSSRTYTIVLKSPPTAAVVVTINSPSDNTEVTAAPPSLTFTSSNWSSPQTVTVSAAHDADEDDETASVTHTVSSSDNSYSGATANSVVVSVIDDDDPQVTVSFDQATYTVAEGDAQLMTVTLNRDPERMLVIPITVTPLGSASAADYSVSPTNVTFNTRDTSKTITFTANQDSLDDDDESVVLAFGTDLPSRVTAGTTATVSITDDDDPLLTVSYGPAMYTVAEGDMVTVTVTLNADPERTVVIPLTATGLDEATAGDYSVSPTSVTFNTGDTVQTITFTATQDSLDDDGERVRLGFGMLPSGVSAGTQATVSITDDDGAGVTVSETVLNVGEGSSETYTIVLASQPTADVIVTINDPSNPDVAADPDNLTFTMSDWSSLQTVTVSAAHDADEDDETASVTHTVSSSDNSYSGATANSVVVSVIDDDDPQVTVSYEPAMYTVAEGDMVTVTVTLSADPQRTVVIPLTATGQDGATAADYSVSPTSVTFNAGDTSKTITFTATQDSLDDDDESVVLAFGADLPSRVTAGTTATVSITDDDDPQVTVSYEPAMYTVAEGDMVTVTVTLSADPQRTVVIPLTATGQDGATAADYSVSPTSVTFNTGDTSKTITFTANQDSLDDDDESVVLAFGAGLPSRVTAGTTATVSITDNDDPQVTVSYGQATYTVAEGDMVTVTVTLNADPERTVVIPLTATPQGTATSADYSGVPASLTFNSGDMSKTFTVTATDDVIDDDGESVRLGFRMLPSGVSAGSTATVSITDDDGAGVTVSETVLNVGEGSSETYTIVLASQPTADVIVTINDLSNTDVTADPDNLTFTMSDWSSAQTVTVSAAQDTDAVDETATVTHSVTSGDNSYDGAPAPSITVNVTDDDNRQVTVSYEPAMYTVAEGDMVTVTVTLNADPERTVVIPLTATPQGTATSADYSGVPASLTFNSGDMSKTFTVTATDDVIDDDGESVRLGFRMLPSGVSAGSTATVSITDNDDPQVTVSFGQATYRVVEGDMVTVTVRLSAEPARAVEIPIRATDQGGASSADYTGVPPSLSFNARDRSKSFSFSALEDDLGEDGERVLLAFETLPDGVSRGRPNEATVNLVDEPGVAGSSPGRGGGGGGGGPPPVPVPSDEDFDWNVTRDIESLHPDNDLPTGLWSNAEVLWVVENSSTGADRLFAYDLNTGERLEEHEFELDSRNRFSHGIWSDGEIVWIADSGQDKLFAYQLETGERATERDLDLDERNRDPRDIWSDGELILVLDSVKRALFAYDLESGRLTAEYPLDKLNNSPRGIWSDGFTIWVSDDGANRIFAYRIESETLNRYEDQEFPFRSLLKAGNGEPRGIWSDGDVIFVADEQDDYVYTYNLPDASIAQLASLSLSGIEFEEFSANRLDYTATTDHDVSVITVEATATQEGAGVTIEPGDADGEPETGHQVSLEAETTITVTVASRDRNRTAIYRIHVSKPPCLEGLTEARLSEVIFVGGSVSELEACARSVDVDALYHHRDGVWTTLLPRRARIPQSCIPHSLLSGSAGKRTPDRSSSSGCDDHTQSLQLVVRRPSAPTGLSAAHPCKVRCYPLKPRVHLQIQCEGQLEAS